LEERVAKKKLEISLSPIAAQIDKAKKKLKSLRSQVSTSDQKKIDLEIKDLKKIRGVVVKACGGRMTHAFSPANDE
jgi:hypothetical protein